MRLALSTLLLIAVAYLAAYAQTYQEFIPIWPSSGLALALLWQHGARYWPAVFISNTVLSMASGTPLLAATGNGSLEVLIMMTALLLLRHWGVHASLANVRQLVYFIAALVAACALAIPIYAMRLAVLFGNTSLQALMYGIDYFLSELFSLVVFAPLLVSWSNQGLPAGAKRWLFLAAMATLAAAGWGVLSIEPSLQDRFLFLLLPLVIVCSLVAGIGGASAASVVLTIVLVASAQASATISDTLLRCFFVLSAALTGYLLAVMFRERERAAAEMEFRAHHDALTGLINRDEFENRLNDALGDASRRYALLYLDLDQFKVVNDTCGHLAGDQMLRQLAARIERALPAGATLARLGGDEFACLLPDATEENVEATARGLHQAVHSFEFPVGELRFTVGVSIGTTLLAAAEDRVPDEVLARADVACYAAKEDGGNRTHNYEGGDADLHGRHSDIQRISQLQAQLSAGEFQLYAQRIVKLSGNADGDQVYEVLLRHAGANGNWPIESVFESAQRYGLLAKLDRWVLQQTAQRLGSRALPNLRLSVNVSATTLESDGFREFVLALPQRYGFLPRQLLLEITEAVAVRNLRRAVETLQALREHGIDICLDDFGSGVASFGYLNDLPVNIVKIDGRFVRDLNKDPTAEIVIESLTRIAALRGILSVAEWVEDAALVPRLLELGVSYAQGYALHMPEPLAAVMA